MLNSIRNATQNGNPVSLCHVSVPSRLAKWLFPGLWRNFFSAHAQQGADTQCKVLGAVHNLPQSICVFICGQCTQKLPDPLVAGPTAKTPIKLPSAPTTCKMTSCFLRFPSPLENGCQNWNVEFSKGVPTHQGCQALTSW